MPKWLEKLLNEKRELQGKVDKLIEERKLDEAEKLVEEIEAIEKEITLRKKIDEKEDEEIERKIDKSLEDKEKPEKKDEIRSFINVLRYETGVETNVDPKDIEVMRSIISETSPEDGGLTVPKDIQTKINELRRSYPDNLEQYVKVEKVNTLSGSRVVEVEADFVPFDKVNEAEIFPDVETPQFKNIPYKVDKFGGTFQLSYELLQDTAENIMGYIRNWAAKKGKATRNAFILKVLEDTYGTKKKAIKGLDDLKDIFNVELDPAIALSSMAITNQDGFNALDKLKDENGNYILQANPTDPTQRLLFGLYPIAVVHNKTLPSKNGKAPIFCGDMKEAITIFDREAFGLDVTDKGPNWNKDLIDAKARERLDVRVFDEDAVVAGNIDIKSVEEESSK